MKIWYILPLILTIILPLSAQILPQPIVIANNPCFNDCLKERSLIFAADNLRNFRKIILHIEEFCDTQEELVKCTELCPNEGYEELAAKTSLSTYICKDKLEEFRLVKECMEKQDADSINKCSTECGHPSDATVQLDSSPASPVNPFVFNDNTTQICRTTECVMKCSIMEFNKICPGSGHLLREIGLKQVMEASKHLQNVASNSSSPSQELIKIYLEILPQQCNYLIDISHYNMTFEQDEGIDDSRILVIEGHTTKSINSMEEKMTSDVVMTRIFGAEFTTQSTDAPKDEDEMKEKMEKETTMISATMNEFGIPIESEKAAATIDNVDKFGTKEEESEEDEEESSKSATDMNDKEEAVTVANLEGEKEEEEEGMKDKMKEMSEEMDHLLHTAVNTQETTERVIVVTDDKNNEIDSNSIKLDDQNSSQKNRTSHAIRERITPSLLIILPAFSLYFLKQ
uniref:Chondroitin proteoglycan 4 domain-containing protein n=2 Tax=Onchocerca TaxID=6281 RepID=A0A8R1XN41_ONCVO